MNGRVGWGVRMRMGLSIVENGIRACNHVAKEGVTVVPCGGNSVCQSSPLNLLQGFN
jgi:hypothetical protein